MKKLIASLITLLPIIAMAQFQLTSNGFKTHDRADYFVYSDSNQSAHQLFNMVKLNINSMAKNGKSIMSNVDDESISVDGNFIIPFKIGGFGNRLDYTVQVKFLFFFKDGKVKINAPVIDDMRYYNGSRIAHLYISKDFDGSGGSGLLGDKFIYKKEDKLNLPSAKEALEETINDYLKSVLKSQNNW